MSTCILVADGDGQGGSNLALLQVVEALAYSRQDEKVSITFDFLFENKRTSPCRLLFVHRGHTVLQPRGENLISSSPKKGLDSWSSLAVLNEIYKDRICRSNGRMGFCERENCYLCREKPTPIDHWQPEAIEIKPCADLECAPQDSFPPVSAFEAPAVPVGVSWFRIHLLIRGLTYEYLVKSQFHFWVDGPERVLDQIGEKDLPERGYLVPMAESFFYERLKPHYISTEAYDVVIYRKGVDCVDADVLSEPITGDVFEAPLANEIQEKARRYVTRSGRFWIDCCYADDLAKCRKTANIAVPDTIVGQPVSG